MPNAIPSGIMLLLLASASAAQVLSTQEIGQPAAPINGGNALSPPAARHIVRIGGTYLLALQHDGAGTRRLTLWQSDDDARTWIERGPMAGTSDRDTADLAVGANGELYALSSWDAPVIFDSTDPNQQALDSNRKIVFEKWTRDATGNFVEQLTSRRTVMDPCPASPCQSPGYAYHRGELTVDSANRIWVQAMLRGPNPTPGNNPVNGDNYQNFVEVAVSTDQGVTFSSQQSPADGIRHGGQLGATGSRAGGRLIAFAGRVLMFWNDHSGNTQTSLRWRSDSNPDFSTASWTAESNAFPTFIGIYHGASMSAAVDAAGALYLAYKDLNPTQLWWTTFNTTTNQFNAPQQLDDPTNDSAQHPAVIAYGDDVWIFTNHGGCATSTSCSYETRMWKRSMQFAPLQRIIIQSAEPFFDGYPNVPASLLLGAGAVPYVYSRTANGGTGGTEVVLRVGFPDFAVSTTAVAVDQGTSGPSTVTLTALNGWTQPVSLSPWTGIPPGAGFSCPASLVTPTASMSCTFSAGTAAANNYTLTSTCSGAGISHPASIPVTVRPQPAGCGPATCPNGCCDGNVCQSGTAEAFCGAPVTGPPGGTTPPGGQACSQCFAGQTCSVNNVATYYVCTDPGCGFGQICP